MNARTVLLLFTVCAQSATHMAWAYSSVVTNGTAVTVTTDTSTFAQSFDAPDVSTVTYMLGGTTPYTPKADSTYVGGTTIEGDVDFGRVMRLGRSNPFGFGPVTLVGKTGLYASESEIDLTNKLYVSDKSFVSSWNSSSAIRLHSIGFSADDYGLRLGRAGNQNEGCAILSLDDPASDPLRCINLLGPVALTLDGGTVEMSETACTPFVSVDNKSTSATPSLTISGNGVRFLVPAGVETSLGLSATIVEPVEQIEVAETLSPANNGFESAIGTEWTVEQGAQTGSGRKSKGSSAFDGGADYTEYNTPDGAYYMMLRVGASICQEVTLPVAGTWRVRFLCGCRPAGTASPQPVSVSLGGKSQEFKFEAGKRFVFTELTSDAFDLSAGPQTLVLSAVHEDGVDKDCNMNFDRIVLERITIQHPKCPISKTGEGDLAFDGQDFAHADLAVSGGTLALVGCSLGGASVSVGNGGCLSLTDSADADDWSTEVAAGGSLAFSDAGLNLVKNHSFEADTNGWRACSATWMLTDWTMEVLETTPVNEGLCGGVQRNGGTITPVGPFTSFGKETAALREQVRLWQTVSIPEDGVYRLSFAYAPRREGLAYKQPIRAKVGGAVVVDETGSTDYFDYRTVAGTIELTAGEYVLSFESDSVPDSGMRSGAMLLIDNVQLRRVKSPSDIHLGEFHLTSGSTVMLDYDGRMRIDNVFVDGVRINGGRSALNRAGVSVVGRGQLNVGEATGLLLLFR